MYACISQTYFLCIYGYFFLSLLLYQASINPFTQTSIKHIKIHYSEVGNSTINTLRVEDGSATSAVVKGLSPDTRYQLRVSSVNSAGESSLSNTIEQRTIVICESIH